MSLIHDTSGCSPLFRGRVAVGVAVGLAVLGVFVLGTPIIQAQRIVDTSPRFAADTASAMARPASGGSVGSGYLVGGFPYGYNVRLAGQNTNYPFSAYGTPRQFGAHDHGFHHVRHPDQARYNQYGRNHWVVSPIMPCPRPYPPFCWAYRPNYFPYPAGCFYPYPPAYCYRPSYPGWNSWGWNPWVGGGVGPWNGLGADFGQGMFAGQGMMAGPGFGGLAPDGWSVTHARSEVSALAPVEIPFATGVVADQLIQRRAADVMAQQRAVAELEAAQSRGRQKIAPSKVAPLERPSVDPLGRSRVQLPTESPVNNIVEPQKSEKSKPKSSAESLAARRIAQAEAERKRLLDTLRQKK